MPRRQLSHKFIEELRVGGPPDSETLYHDLNSRLILRHRASGAMSFVIRARLNGKLVRPTCQLAVHGKNLRAAREWAQEAADQCSGGIDPTKEKRRKREEEKQRESTTFESVAADFVQSYCRDEAKLKSADETDRIFKRLWEGKPTLAKTPIGDVTKAMIMRELRAIPSPYVANRALSSIRQCLDWAAERGLIEISPLAGQRRLARKGEDSRTRVLKPDELRAVWLASDKLGAPSSQATKLLMLTLQRRAEVAEAKRAEFKLNLNKWTIPSARTKAGRSDHDVPLSAAAAKIIESVPVVEDSDGHATWLFTNTGDVPISNGGKWKQRLDEVARVENWRLHDFRRAGSTYLSKLGIAPLVIAATLNHSPRSLIGIGATYNRDEMWAPKQRALAAWSRLLLAMVDERVWQIVEPLFEDADMDAPEKAAEFRQMIVAGDGKWTTYWWTLTSKPGDHQRRYSDN